ncbi:MAG TPA: hypothetical protein VFT04_12880 [Gemmatimonadales bacterium]|nr:hypothetical protein [Gemmatimonadales bacterium]
MRVPVAGMLLTLVACSGADDRANVNCGIVALASPQTLLSEFGVPRQTLSRPPADVPGRIVARIAAGPTLPAIVGRESVGDSLLVVGVEGSPPDNMALGFGVLVTTPDGTTRGVMLYEGLPVEGAPRIGSVTLGSVTAPLLGLEADPASYENADCPLFPDSTAAQAAIGQERSIARSSR